MANVLIFGTPVYWYGPTALMKAFIDRLVYFNCPAHRRGIRGKHAAVVIPYEEREPETVAPVVGFFRNCFRYLDVQLVDELIVPGVTRRGEVSQKVDVMLAAREMGERLASLARAD